MSHSPIPWQVHFNGKSLSIIDYNNAVIAQNVKPEDAQLMVFAPEMLSALLLVDKIPSDESNNRLTVIKELCKSVAQRVIGITY